MTHITAKLKRELVSKIDPEKHYPVNYTINQDRTRNNTKTYLQGKDLTENQIIDLWKAGEL
jgi:DNA/RNA-binding domain of Phe-tRNA-synthetase-like protein